MGTEPITERGNERGDPILTVPPREATTEEGQRRAEALAREESRPPIDRESEALEDLARQADEAKLPGNPGRDLRGLVQRLRDAYGRMPTADAALAPPDVDAVEAVAREVMSYPAVVAQWAAEQALPSDVPATGVDHAAQALAMATLDLELSVAEPREIPRVAAELAASYGPGSLEASLLLSSRWGRAKLRTLADESTADPLADARATYLETLGGVELGMDGEGNVAYSPGLDHPKADLLRFARAISRIYGLGAVLASRAQEARELQTREVQHRERNEAIRKGEDARMRLDFRRSNRELRKLAEEDAKMRTAATEPTTQKKKG